MNIEYIGFHFEQIFIEFNLCFFLQFKQMNESKLRKGTKYVTLKDEDVHTVTGALKQFYRELKTDLIPIEIVKRLPDDLGMWSIFTF